MHATYKVLVFYASDLTGAGSPDKYYLVRKRRTFRAVIAHTARFMTL